MHKKHRNIVNGTKATAVPASLTQQGSAQSAQNRQMYDSKPVRKPGVAGAKSRKPRASACPADRHQDLVQLCELVDAVRVGGYPKTVVEDAKSKMKAKLCASPKCLKGFRGEAPLANYLHVSVKRMCHSVHRKEARYNGGTVSDRNPASRHAKLYQGFGEGSDAKHIGIRAVIAGALFEASFGRKRPTHAGRPTSLRGAIGRGFLRKLRQVSDVVIACAHGRVAGDDGKATYIVATLRSHARADPVSCFEVAHEGYECLMGLCEACETQFAELGNSIRATAKRELRQIRQDLAAIAPIVNQVQGVVAAPKPLR